MMKKLRKAQKMGITFAVLCCALLVIVFSADHKKLFARVTDALNALTGTEAMTTVDSMVVMNTEDAQQTDDYYAFGVYAPSAATYTIGVTAENGKMRINTGEAIAVDGTEVSVSLTEGTNVLYFVDCENPSIQWNSENCDLEPVNKVCMPLSGDVNQSENRTVEDLVLIKKEADTAGTGNIDRVEIADIDGDDSVTNEDARLLRTLMVGNPECEVAERCPLIVDAYIEETGTLYDTLADAVEAASTISTTNSKSVSVTVLNPTDVKLVKKDGTNISISVTDGAKIELKDDGWCRTITRDSTGNFKMFGIGTDASLTLSGSSESDVNSSLILDGGAKASGGNHVIDVGNALGATTAELIMNAGVKITNNENNGASSSGGALAVRGTFNMNGGVISENIAKGTGGAINLLNGSVMNMAGGTITENETKTETSSGGGINVSAGATLVMEGGKVYGNISPVSVGNNSVRVSGETSVLKMGGAAYIDRVCIDTASSVTPYIELTSALTTTEPITLFFPQPLNKTGNVVHRDSSCAASDSIFQLSERMLPCTLVQDDSNENLCLKSSTEGMDKIKASLVYNNYDFADDTWAVQGVCSDGTYLYAAIEQEETVGVTFNGCKILKVNLATWQVVEISKTVLPTDHSNEMTYNPNTGKIYITHCMSSGEFEEITGLNKDNGPYAVSVVDPSDLDKVERVIQLSDTTAYTGTTGIYGLAYNNSRGYYVAGCTGFRFGFLADSGEMGNEDYTIKETTMPSTGMVGFSGYTSYTKQGVYANDTTIYTNNWNDKDKMNLITMYDWRGNYNGTKYVVDQNGNAFTQESESLFEYKGDMYMACIPTGHKGVDIYKLEDVGKVASPIDVKDANGVVVDDGYVNLADAITKANELETATIVLKEDVIISTTQTITGNVTITDDGTKRTLRRSTGCKNEMFNVAGGATLTFTSSSENDNNPMLVIDGNKENVTTSGYAPVVDMDQTDGILNIKPGVIVQNNKSHASGGIVFAGKNDITSAGGGRATINITGGLFKGNEIEYLSSKYLFGGCIYIESGCTLNISNATFANTKMVQDATDGMTYGGVISARTSTAQQNGDKGASITLEDCVFKNTSVTQKGSASANGGGVLYLRDQNPGSVQIINCEFLDNSTKGSGGAIYMSNTKTPIELSGCSFSNNTDANGTNDIYMVASTNVNVSSDTQANIYCAGQEQIHITETFGTESKIKVTVPDTAMAGTTVATFASEDIMTACKGNRNIVLSETSYALSYDATNLNATLVDAVAVVGDSGYAFLADAIEAANALDSATIVLKADVTVDETQEITGKVTITNNEIARTITRGNDLVEAMFDVTDTGNFTIVGTQQSTITVNGNKDIVTATNSMIVNDGTFTLGANAMLTNGGADSLDYGGALRNTGTAKLQGTISNHTAVNGGAIYNYGAGQVTYDGGTYTSNTSIGRGGAMYGAGTSSAIVTNGTFSQNTAQGQYGGGVFGIAGNASLTVNEGTFTGNSANNASYDGTSPYGGGAIESNGDLTINGGTFESNTAYNGGAIYLDSSCTANITAGTFGSKDKGNTAENSGGAIYLKKSSTTGAKVTIEGGTFAYNEAVGITGGGAIAGATLTTIEVKGGTFSNNSATSTITSAYGGGAIETNGALNISDGTFDTNTAFKGGAVYVDVDGELSVSGGEYYNNETHDVSGGEGGVIYNAGNNMSITGGTFGATDKGNIAHNRGGAVYINASNCQEAEITGATFIGNCTTAKRAISAGAVYVNGAVNLTVKDCLFDNNSINYTGTSTDNVSYGGIMYINGNGVVNIEDTIITNNEAWRGGAIYVSGDSASLTLKNTSFSGNTAKIYADDVFCNKGQVTLLGKVNVCIDLHKEAKSIYVSDSLTAESSVTIRELVTVANRVFINFKDATVMENSKTYFALHSVHTGKILSFGDNQATMVAK